MKKNLFVLTMIILTVSLSLQACQRSNPSTPLPENTATHTLTPLPPDTATVTPTVTMTETPSVTETVTLTATLTATATATPTSTNTPDCTYSFGDNSGPLGGYGNNGYIFAASYTAASSGVVSSIAAYTQAGGSFIVALYSDNAGQPGNVLAQSASTIAENGYTRGYFAPVTVNSGSVYWLAVISDVPSVIRLRSGGVAGKYIGSSFASAQTGMPSGISWMNWVTNCPLSYALTCN